MKIIVDTHLSYIVDICFKPKGQKNYYRIDTDDARRLEDVLATNYKYIDLGLLTRKFRDENKVDKLLHEELNEPGNVSKTELNLLYELLDNYRASLSSEEYEKHHKAFQELFTMIHQELRKK